MMEREVRKRKSIPVTRVLEPVKKSKLHVCTGKLPDGEPCLSRYSRKEGLTKHFANKHATPAQQAVKQWQTRLSGMINNAAISVASFVKSLNLLKVPVPVLTEQDVNMDNQFVKTMVQVLTNRQLHDQTAKPFYGSIIVLMDRKFWDPTKSLDENILQHKHNPEFLIAVFFDTSSTKGPCPFHTFFSMCDGSLVAWLAKQNWVAFTNNITFSEGRTRDENKDLAYEWQQIWELANFLCNSLPLIRTGPKIVGLNCTTNQKHSHSITGDGVMSAITKWIKNDSLNEILGYPPFAWTEYKIAAFFAAQNGGKKDNSVKDIVTYIEEKFPNRGPPESAVFDEVKLDFEAYQAKRLNDLYSVIENFIPRPDYTYVRSDFLAATVVLSAKKPLTVNQILEVIWNAFPLTREVVKGFNVRNLRVSLSNHPWFVRQGKKGTHKVKFSINSSAQEDIDLKLNQWMYEYESRLVGFMNHKDDLKLWKERKVPLDTNQTAHQEESSEDSMDEENEPYDWSNDNQAFKTPATRRNR
ncbi:uncharacterized protein LOC118435222 [Folsomia candida]|uniref:uncharacterized protein LOC118435222 n=1 Tax=Folsomia candida TaxID=158441 RepID=UPI0016055536|nr:uncharacterized protein LOC118435222 [Folsomia candida]